MFANVLLADEVNRTPPKTQAALLQAMQEREVTSAGKTFELPEPFLVFATQNPIEQEGTYVLPEAQLDRFMFMINVGYPSLDEEVRIVQTTTSDHEPQIENGRVDPSFGSPAEIISSTWFVTEHISLTTDEQASSLVCCMRVTLGCCSRQ